MAMFDFAVLAAKMLFFIWALQLIWIGSYLLESFARGISQSLLMLVKQKGRPKAVSL